MERKEKFPKTVSLDFLSHQYSIEGLSDLLSRVVLLSGDIAIEIFVEHAIDPHLSLTLQLQLKGPQISFTPGLKFLRTGPEKEAIDLIRRMGLEIADALTSYTAIRQISQFVGAVLFFHVSEYVLAIYFHGCSKVSWSSLLISKHYALAMGFALVEYMVEITLFPQSKERWFISNCGLVMILIGEVIRKAAIVTAGRSFTHLIRIYYEEQHRLITHGVYSIMRHPSYCGFFIWAIGTQIMLRNPISLIAFILVLWRFFSKRIPYEEFFLRQFFGRDYIEYARKVPSGLPFIK